MEERGTPGCSRAVGREKVARCCAALLAERLSEIGIAWEGGRERERE